MNHKAHRSIAKMFFPNIKFKDIDAVNSAIDNPSKRMMAYQTMTNLNPKAFDLFGLTKHGHRKYNHDVSSAIISAYTVAPHHAAELAVTHLMVDKLGNFLHDAYGAENKELIEAMINKYYALYRETSGEKMRKPKRMFY